MSTSRPFPGFSSLYAVGENGDDRGFRAAVEDVVVDHSFEVTRGDWTAAVPMRARWTMGSTAPSDLIWTTAGNIWIVSDRVADVLGQGGFAGWETYPVEVVGKNGRPFSGYRGLRVRGRCGPLDPSRSALSTKKLPRGSLRIQVGLYFDPASWDGSDIFMSATRSGWVFTTAKLKAALDQARVSGLRFVPLDQVEQVLAD